MKESTVVFLPSAEGVEDRLTEVLRAGARELVRHAVEAEVAALLRPTPIIGPRPAVGVWCVTGMARSGRSLTGIGPVVVRRPKVRDRGGTGGGPELAGLRRLDPQDPPLPVQPVPAQRHDLSPPHPGIHPEPEDVPRRRNDDLGLDGRPPAGQDLGRGRDPPTHRAVVAARNWLRNRRGGRCCPPRRRVIRCRTDRVKGVTRASCAKRTGSLRLTHDQSLFR